MSGLVRFFNSDRREFYVNPDEVAALQAQRSAYAAVYNCTRIVLRSGEVLIADESADTVAAKLNERP